MKNVVKSLSGVICLLFALSGCRMFSPTFTYTPEMREVREKALAGDVESMRQMATYHWPESSPHMSHEETCRWLQRASDAGDAMSSELLGWCYLIGDGVPQSRENAARQLYARIVREAKLSELEAEVVLSNYLDETDWWIEHE